jgi:hypothetical protein
VESFNARLRDELLDGEIFYSLREAPLCQGSCPVPGYDLSFSGGRDGGMRWPTRRSAVRRF